MVKKKIKINESYWTVIVVTEKEMSKEHENGEDIAGLCIPARKEILIEERNLDERTVLHEIFHAYFSDLHLSDTSDVSLADVEEVMASFFSEKAEIVLAKGKKLTKSLQKKYLKENE